MMQISAPADNLIRALKQREAFADVRFVREFPSREAEIPVRGYLAAVCVTQTACAPGFLGNCLGAQWYGKAYTAGVEIRVYAPDRENGSGLSALVSEMLAAVRDCDEQRLITAASASALKTDMQIGAVYRSLQLKMEFFVCGEE